MSISNDQSSEDLVVVEARRMASLDSLSDKYSRYEASANRDSAVVLMLPGPETFLGSSPSSRKL
jgi:hypothetical protein